MNYPHVVLVNAFSINMMDEFQLLDIHKEIVVRFEQIHVRMAAHIIETAISEGVFHNCMGHTTSDALVRDELTRYMDGTECPKGVRETVKLSGQERVVVAQYQGPRLPKGAVSLPEEAQFKYWEAKL